MEEIFRNHSGICLIDYARATSTEEEFVEFIDKIGVLQLINKGDLPAIKYLYSMYPKVVKETPCKLTRAAINNNIEIVRYILSIRNYGSGDIFQVLDQLVIGSDTYNLLFKQLDDESVYNQLNDYIESKNFNGIDYILERNLSQKNLDRALNCARTYYAGLSPDRDVIDRLLNAGAIPSKDIPNLYPLPKPQKLA